MNHRHDVYVSVEPFIDYMAKAHLGPGDLNRNLQRTYCLAKSHGRLTVLAADDLAMAVGRHPSSIWSNWWTV